MAPRAPVLKICVPIRSRSLEPPQRHQPVLGLTRYINIKSSWDTDPQGNSRFSEAAVISPDSAHHPATQGKRCLFAWAMSCNVLSNRAMLLCSLRQAHRSALLLPPHSACLDSLQDTRRTTRWPAAPARELRFRQTKIVINLRGIRGQLARVLKKAGGEQIVLLFCCYNALVNGLLRLGWQECRSSRLRHSSKGHRQLNQTTHFSRRN